MTPTREQIAVAAYHRWERRGRPHGADRDDWVAAEKDLTFGLNYRYVARYPLAGPVVNLGERESSGRRRCRFCELSEPTVSFEVTPAAVPASLGNKSLLAWDECDDCRAFYDSHLADGFEAFALPWVEGRGEAQAVPVAAWKGLVRLALAVAPASELHHFGDTAEWVANPEHSLDAGLLRGEGCHVYVTPAPVASPFVALARRVGDEGRWPYALFFLGSGRAVFQTHLPLCPLDEDLDDPAVRGPELSMTVGSGQALRSSDCRFLPVEAAVPRPAASRS